MKKINNEQGQSTVEFILAFSFGVSFILTIFTTSFNYGKGYLVQYATFMASRVYLTSDNFIGGFNDSSYSLGYAEEKSKSTFAKYELNRFGVPATSYKVNAPEPSQLNTYLTVGGYTTFEMKTDPIGTILGQQKLQMISESFLGKEPTRAECATRVCFAITGESSCDRSLDITNFDNGC